MKRIAMNEAARIKGGDCTGLHSVMLISAIAGAWEIALAAYVASQMEGC